MMFDYMLNSNPSVKQGLMEYGLTELDFVFIKELILGAPLDDPEVRFGKIVDSIFFVDCQLGMWIIFICAILCCREIKTGYPERSDFDFYSDLFHSFCSKENP